MKKPVSASLLFCAVVGTATIVALVISLFLSAYESTVGMLATCISIVLALASMVYSSKTSEKAARTLDEIKRNNKALVEEIARAQTEANYGEMGFRNVRDELERRRSGLAGDAASKRGE